MMVHRGVSWGGFGGLGPPGHLRGAKKKRRKRKGKGKKKRKEEGKKRKKKEKGKSAYQIGIGRHSHTSRGSREDNSRGAKLTAGGV